METKQLFLIIGELYTKLYEVETENQKLKLLVRNKEEQLEFARINNGSGQPQPPQEQRISSK